MGFFLPMPPAAGGATEKSWHRLAVEFARRGHEVTILSRQWRDWPEEEIREGVRHVRVPGFAHTGSLLRNLWRDLRWSLRVSRKLPAADVTAVNCLSLPAWLGWFQRRPEPVVVMPGRMPKGQYRFYRGLARVLAVSSPVRDAVLTENPSLAAVTTITGYPIDCASLSRVPREPRPSDATLTVGYVGRIHREKGLHLLAAAVRELARRTELPRWRFVLCGPTDIERGGSGPDYATELMRLAGDAASHVELCPPIFEEEKLATLYRSFDVFCYPSVATRGETFGVAVAEAMAAGAVPVVSSLTCFTDFIRPDENGVTFDHEPPDAPLRLANSLAALLGDSTRRNRLAAAAVKSVQHFDFRVFADRLLADFSTLK